MQVLVISSYTNDKGYTCYSYVAFDQEKKSCIGKPRYSSQRTPAKLDRPLPAGPFLCEMNLGMAYESRNKNTGEVFQKQPILEISNIKEAKF